MGMLLTALMFLADGNVVRKQLEWDSTDSLRAVLSQGRPAAYVVRTGDLTQLREFNDIIVDRGRKHRAKSLAKLLLGKTKVPLIEGSYSDLGQLRRSLRTLLARAVARGDLNAYIIGVDAALFDLLWNAGAVTAAPLRRNGWEYALSELVQVTIPDSLVAAYVGISPHTQLVRQLIVYAARSEAPVLITGPMGSGKEVVARCIHGLSARDPFVPLNCAAVPSGLIESELFGYAAHAFTGAPAARDGLWKFAGKGTLFLDEIGDVPIDLQPKLLRALEERKIRPLATAVEIDAPARIVSATSRDLATMIDAGQFRSDLYYRLSIFTIPAAPLNQRREDIPILAQFFWKRLTGAATLPPAVCLALQGHSWPGNVRELNSVLTKLYALFGTEVLGVEQLRTALRFHYLPLQSTLAQSTSFCPHVSTAVRAVAKIRPVNTAGRRKHVSADVTAPLFSAGPSRSDTRVVVLRRQAHPRDSADNVSLHVQHSGT